MCSTRLQGFGFCVRSFGSEARNEDLEVRIQNHPISYHLCKSSSYKPSNVVDGCVSTDQRQQTWIITVGVGEFRSTAG